MLLAHSKVKWVDEVIKGDEFYPRKIAGEFPNGQLPVLVHNGRYYNESMAILRFLGKKFGYYPSGGDDAWYVDATVDYINDYLQKTYPTFQKLQFNEKYFAEYQAWILAFIEHFEKQLASNSRYLCGAQITTADFMASSYIFTFIWNQHSKAPAEWLETG